MYPILIEVIKYGLPAFLVGLTAYSLVKTLLNHQTELRDLELSLQKTELAYKMRNETLPLRLQAYERLVLYLERIAPSSLLSRVRQEDMTVPELQMALVMTVRAEMEHNITQQLYVSPELWGLIQVVTEEMLTVYNSLAQRMINASTNDYVRAIFEYFLSNEHALPTQKAIDALKNEAMLMFN